MEIFVRTIVFALISACFAGALAEDAKSGTNCAGIADASARLVCFDSSAMGSSSIKRTTPAIFAELDALVTSYIEGRGFSGLVLDGCKLTSFYAASGSEDYVLHEILKIDLSYVAGLGEGRGRAEDTSGVKFDLRSSNLALRAELTPSRGVARDITPEWADQLEQILTQASSVPVAQFEALMAASFPNTVLSNTMLMQSSVTLRYFKDDPSNEILRKFAELVGSCRSTEPTTAQPKQAPAKFEPERGTDLRRALLAAVRSVAENAFDAPIEFMVDTLDVSGDIAFASVRSQRPGGAQISFDDTPAFRRGEIVLEVGTPGEVQALLRWNGTKWQVVRAVLQPTEAWWLDDCATWVRLFPQHCSASQQVSNSQPSNKTLNSGNGRQPVAKAVAHDVDKPVLTSDTTSVDPIDELVLRCEAQLNKATVGPACMMVKPETSVTFAEVVVAMQRHVRYKVLTTEGVIEASGLHGVMDEGSVLEAGRQYAFFF